MPTAADIARMIDHALLKPTLTSDELDAGCRLARDYAVASVCIMPFAVARCAELLAGSTVVPSTVIGFPHGVNATSTKAAEAARALADGAVELDMVVNVSKVLSGDWDFVRDDISAVLGLVRDNAGAKLKVIFENAYLEDAHKIRLCEICGELAVDWVKTSTGFASSGATAHDLKLMRKHSPEGVQVKASGGVRDLDTILKFREIGVSRIGASGTAALVDEARKRLG